jgi:hypothetical protein
MSKIIEVIQSLPNLLPLEKAEKKDIIDAELQLRVSFSDEYKEYLSAFGAILADGIELTGIAKSKSRNVVTVTFREWDQNNNVPHTMYVIEELGDEGVIIWQDSAGGAIYQTAPNTEPKQIANSFTEYVSNRSR